MPSDLFSTYKCTHCQQVYSTHPHPHPRTHTPHPNTHAPTPTTAECLEMQTDLEWPFSPTAEEVEGLRAGQRLTKLLLWALAQLVAKTINAFHMRFTGHGGRRCGKSEFSVCHTTVPPFTQKKDSFQGRHGFPSTSKCGTAAPLTSLKRR